MKAKIAALMLILCSPAFAQLDFKGVKFGSSLDEFRQEFVTASSFSCGPTIDRITTCKVAGETFANNETKNITAMFLDWKLAFVEVEFGPAYFDDNAKALAEKYGKPSSTRAYTVKNAMNASFVQNDITWFIPKHGAVTATKYSPDLLTSRAQFLSTDWQQEMQRRIKEKPPAKKDV